jgi:conjugal transfer/entry exclusion protein
MTMTYEAQLIEKYFSQMQDEIAKKTTDLVDFPAADHAAYRGRCGTIGGLKRAIEIWKEVQAATRSDGKESPKETPRRKANYED